MHLFDDYREEICNSKAFVDLATAGRHRGLSTIYIKQNLFHQSKLGRDVEIQNTYIVILKSPRDVMQVVSLSAELGFRSELVDWYRDAKSVPFGHLLIDLLPRADDRLRYCTNTGLIPSKFFYPGPTETVKFFGRSTHKIFLLSKCSNHFPTNAKVFSFSPKEFIQFLCECTLNLIKGNLRSIKRHHVAKFQSEVRLLFLQRTTWKQRRDILAFERGLQLIKVITPPVIKHLS